MSFKLKMLAWVVCFYNAVGWYLLVSKTEGLTAIVPAMISFLPALIISFLNEENYRHLDFVHRIGSDHPSFARTLFPFWALMLILAASLTYHLFF